MSGSRSRKRETPSTVPASGGPCGLADHLAPGGVLVVEPWYERARDGEAAEGDLDLVVAEEPDRKIVRLCRARRHRSMVVMDQCLVADSSGTSRFTERHELRLFALGDHVDAVVAAGLRAVVDDYGLWGHGLVLGVAPGE